jgi:hypothetical protein
MKKKIKINGWAGASRVDITEEKIGELEDRTGILRVCGIRGS